MSQFEVSIDGRNLFVESSMNGARKCFAFHATLLVEAHDPKKAEAEALFRVKADPSVAGIAAEPPELSVDSVSEIRSTRGPVAMHGPIFCFFEAQPELASN